VSADAAENTTEGGANAATGTDGRNSIAEYDKTQIEQIFLPPGRIPTHKKVWRLTTHSRDRRPPPASSAGLVPVADDQSTACLIGYPVGDFEGIADPASLEG
jgi:hypothetical protein